eukprot:TRINITY_DN8398_c0_g1_i2.p1 TRINITY_DN8398_c0_g1~~TRINITY_DN8398_c0_g1_i2.p1  ORF type:complete len:552 (+),score=154.28 TRINITY_DN8398_c0_g1_i2:59-1714(+)
MQVSSASSLSMLNPNAASVGGNSARAVILNAAKGLSEVMSTNLGPRGTMKMLVSGAGEIKLSKDGNVLLQDMQFQHPIAQLIARAVTAQDDVAGDGTTSTVLLIGELLRLAEHYIRDGIHVRSVVEGYALAKDEVLKFLESFKKPVAASIHTSREVFVRTAFTALNTKISPHLVLPLSEICVDAVACIDKTKKQAEVDLHMVEIMSMTHKLGSDTAFVKGIVLDHGTRHPDMPKRLENCFILTCNASLEYEKSEVNSEWNYDNAAMKNKMMRAERKIVDVACQRIIALKRQVCTDGEGFVVINQKGIDALALDMLAKEGIMGLRRAKKRNMERLVLACGGVAVNSFDGLLPTDLGRAERVYEHVLAEEKYTFVECENPASCTILVKGPNKHTILQLTDAVRDGLRAVKHTMEDACVVPGGGAFEVAALVHLEELLVSTHGHAKIGIRAFGEALSIIPRTLCNSSGRDDSAYMLIEMQDAYKASKAKGLEEYHAVDVVSGELGDAEMMQVWDMYRAKRYMINSAVEIASNLMLCDEIMKAGAQKGGRGKIQE